MARPVDKPWPPPRDMHHPRPLVRGARGTLCADRTTVQALGQRGGCLQGRPKEPFLRWLRIFPRGQGLVSPDVDNPVLCFIGCAVLWGPIVLQLFACAVLVSEEITEPVCLPLLRPVPVGWEPQRRETGLPMGCPTSVLHTSPTQGSKPGGHSPLAACGCPKKNQSPLYQSLSTADLFSGPMVFPYSRMSYKLNHEIWILSIFLISPNKMHLRCIHIVA